VLFMQHKFCTFYYNIAIIIRILLCDMVTDYNLDLFIIENENTLKN
jgi:hypothetical protein